GPPGARPAEAQRDLDQRSRELRREGELALVVAGEQERGVQVAVAGVAPRRRGNADALTRFERRLDRLAEPVERNGDVLARLAAALRVDDEGEPVAPAPERRALLPSFRR